MKPVLSVQKVSVRYVQTEAISNVTMEINKGDFIGIVGPNGGGKSTLVKSILGIVTPSKGSICFCDETKNIGYVPQLSAVNRDFPITVQEVVEMGLLPKTVTPFFRFKKNEGVERVLELVGLLELRDRQINQLSGGEFKKVLIARALVNNPDLLILDEPAAMVDRESRNHIYSLLEELKGEVTILLVTHNIHDTKHLLTKVYNVNHTADIVEIGGV